MHTKKEQFDYIQGQINKIKKSAEERQSRIAWQTVNYVKKSKRISRAKLKAASQEDRTEMWKEHFKKLLGKCYKVRDKPTIKNINDQLNIKLR